ncbi:MAG: AraC family transcriptional regulator [Desulfobacterales bacterium]|nr:AraC family transcriptional regulator [Desulfobacterales bacterium]
MNGMNALKMEHLTGHPSPGYGLAREPLNVTPRHGRGCLVKSVELSGGLSLHLQDFRIHGNGSARIQRDPIQMPGLFFYTCLSGVRGIAETWPGKMIIERLSGIELCEYPTTSMEILRNRTVRTMTVGLAPDTFSRLTGQTRQQVLEMLGKIRSNARKKTYLSPLASLDLDLKLAAGEAMAAATTQNRDPLYLKAKTLECLSLHLRQLGHLAGNPSADRQCAGKRVARACRILKKEMERPPGARELARRVGLNHNLLVAEFKSCLGILPFEYLRTVRLDRARTLMEEGRCNVTQASIRVGYASPSHFTKAFRDRFGLSPREWARQRNTTT